MSVVIRSDVVNESVAELARLNVHQHFAGYLCLIRLACAMGRTTALKADFKEFFDTFLRVPNAPQNAPYLRPFTRGQGGEAVWNQANVAGSYAQSSLREYGPFRKVVDVTGTGSQTQYNLRPGHTQLAFEHLAFGGRVPVVPLAIYLYRNFAFTSEDDTSAATVVQVFRYEFGYGNFDPEAKEFPSLFTDESAVGSTAEMFAEAPA